MIPRDPHLQLSAGAGQRLLSGDYQGASALLCAAPQAKPPGCRNALRNSRRCAGQINDDNTESAGMNKQVGGLQSLVGTLAAYPQQARQIDARPRRCLRIEPILRVHQNTAVPLRHGRAEHRQQEAGPTGRDGSGHVGQRRARDAAGPINSLNTG